MSEISIESPLIGNRYQLEEKLGAGGMGVVYRAIDRLTSDPVALKRVNVKPRNLRFSTRSDDSSEVLELALAREFKTLASFRHPHIISVLDYGFDEHQQPYFTMPLLTYPQDIVNYARNRTRHEQGLLLVQILQALAYLHRQGVLHRDLKPANVLVADGQVRVLDFGLAIAREELAEGREAIVGTLAYMAPEVLRGELPTEAADLYAIGVIAYEIFAGQHPFHLDASFHNLMLEILTTDPDFSKIQTHSLVPTSPDPITNDDDSTTLFDPEKTTPRENPLPPVPVRAQPIEPIILEGDKLVAFVRQLMVKNPTQRYPSAESTIQALCAALDLPIPAETLAIRESFLQAARFVGRQKERLQLEQALSQAIAGHGGAWLVGGESGVGKSRLLDELRIRALVQRTMVLRGQAVAEGGLPYQLWRDIVRRLVISTALNDLEAGILKEILPDISTLLGRNVPDAPQLDGKAAQQRLVQTIADVFKRQTQPILLLLEDLQWTSESLEALKQLNLFVGESPWLIVGTYRDDEMPGLPEQLPGMQVMRLERLDETAMREMSAAVLGEAGRQQAIIDLLKRETEGNALFVVEVVRALAEEAGTLGAISLMNLPERVTAGGIQHILRRRIGRVPDWAQPTLKLAAVAGRQLDLQILDKTNASVDWEAWLAACMGVAVLEISDGRWQFTHDKLRETALSDLDPQERQVLHRTIAEAIETAYPDDKSQAAILTEHWHQAGNPAKELHYARLAIEQMIAVSAFRQAATMAERTLPLTTNDLSARAALLNLLGNAQAGLSNYEQAAAYHEESLSLSRQIDDKKAHMTALMYLGDINRLQGQFAEAQSYYNQSLTLAREIGDQRIAAKSLNGLGNITRYQGDYQLALRYNEESLAIKQEIGDRGEIANGLLNLAAIYWDQGDHGRAKSYFEQCLDIFRQVGDRQGAALCLYNLGNVAYSTEDNEAAKAYFEQSKMIFHEIGDQYGLAYSLGGLGNVADEQGDYLAAHSAYEEGLLIFRSIGDQWGVAIHLNNLGNTSRKSGDAGKARRYWRDALQVLGEIEGTPLILDVLGGYAHLYLQENNPHKCAELVGLIDQHPAVADQTRQNHTIPLKADLEAVLSESEREAAFQRGRGFDLQTVVVELMNA